MASMLKMKIWRPLQSQRPVGFYNMTGDEVRYYYAQPGCVCLRSWVGHVILRDKEWLCLNDLQQNNK